MPNTHWSRLTSHAAEVSHHTLRELFQQQPNRAERFSVQTCGIFLDYSKNRITDKTMQELLALANSYQLTTQIQKLLQGAEVNTTECRPALHTALRRLHQFTPLLVNGVDVMPRVRQQLAKMRQLVKQIHEGDWKGYSGKSITDVVNIGIGGSDLGPRMVVKALTPYHCPQVRCHFVANVDATDLLEVLKLLNPETTLFIVASKSFSTQETLMNAETARTWLLAQAGHSGAVSQHFIAISSKPSKAEAFGINPNNVFEMWDWVGGRYSLWSTIGLPIALAIGMTEFEQLLVGAEQMDWHFSTAPLAQNMPVILALLGVWYIEGFGCQSQAVIPYDEFLQLLPNYLQQLDMESNGKSVTVSGKPATRGTAPVLWGGVGTNGQHAYHQLLHQGTVMVPVDFIVATHNHHALESHQAVLYANCLAQSQALMQGKTLEEAIAELRLSGKSLSEIERLAQHKVSAGNRPSNTLVIDQLTPKTLGSLLALYEHKVFVQSVLWEINAFDQWGVELGKQLGEPILARLKKLHTALPLDSSTEQLIARYHRDPK